MKKTWTTKILIALMTLAMIVGVVAIAPKEAQALVNVNSSGSMSQTVTVGSSITEIAFTAGSVSGYTTPTYEWAVIDSNLPDSVNITNETNQTCYINYPSSQTGVYKFRMRVTVTDTATTRSDVGYSNWVNVTVNPVPTPMNVTAPTSVSATVDANITGCEFTLTGDPMPDKVTVDGLGSDLKYTYNKSARTVTITGKPTTAGSRTITVTASNGISGPGSASVTFDVDKATPVITLTSEKDSVALNDTIQLTANNAPSGGTYNWTVDGTPATEKGRTFSYRPTSLTPPTSVNIAVTWIAPTTGSNYNDSNEADKTINVTQMSPGLWANASRNSASYGSGAITLTAGTSNNANSAESDFLWEITNNPSGGKLEADVNVKSILFTPASAGTGPITTTVRVTYTNADYVTEYKTLTITVSPAFEVNPTSLTLRENNASVQSFNVVTAANADVTAVSSNENVAKVEKTYTSDTKTVHTFTVKPGVAGDATITVYYAGTTKTVNVHVASATPVISQVDFVSSDLCTPYLNKVNNYGYLTITVKDYNPTNPYVTVTRSNIRTFIQGGRNNYSHNSTYSYIVTLTPTNNGLDGWAQLDVKPQYNGTTYYTVAYTGATAKNSPTIYVTGHTTLPQTGPNYIWAYVLGGLCLATVATAVALNVRKKKRENI